MRWTRPAVLLAGFATPAAAQPPRLPPVSSPLDTARVQQALNDQKAEAAVTDAVREADRLFATNPVTAARRIQAAIDAVGSSAVSPATRETLTATLSARLRAYEGRSATAAVGPKLDPAGPKAVAARAAAWEAARDESAAVATAVAGIKTDELSGRTRDARLKAATLQAKYPNNPAVVVLNSKGNFGDAIAAAQALVADQDKRYRLALNDVSKSALPSIGDIEFPADWKEKTRRRVQGPELTAKEQAVLKSLDAPLTLSARERPFEEVLQELSNAMGQEIFVDKKSLEDAGRDLKGAVSVAGKGLSARTYLRQILAGQGLTFVVQDEVVKVVTAERARDLLATRVYYLGDIVQGLGPNAGALQWGTAADYQQTMANAEVVIDAIMASVDPMSWKAKGGHGAGTITFHAASMSIIVRASTEVHAALGARLGGKGR